jgi:hypothetical protein
LSKSWSRIGWNIRVCALWAYNLRQSELNNNCSLNSCTIFWG